MTAPDRLCLFASPRDGDADGATAHLLKQAGVTLWVWPPLAPQTTPPAAFDALVVLAGSALPPAAQPALVALLRQAWLHGATIGLFEGAATLLADADIAPGGTPLEAAGLFIAEEAPGPGMVQEFIDALQSGPHLDR